MVLFGLTHLLRYVPFCFVWFAYVVVQLSFFALKGYVVVYRFVNVAG